MMEVCVVMLPTRSSYSQWNCHVASQASQGNFMDIESTYFWNWNSFWILLYSISSEKHLNLYDIPKNFDIINHFDC